MATANSKLKIDYGFDAYGNSNVDGTLTVTGDVSVGGNLSFSGTTVGNFIPDADQRSLGNTVNRWNLLGYTANLASTLTVTGATSLEDTLAVTKTISGGNTTITGFANISVSVNSSLLTVGTSFIANTTGIYHTGVVNASSITLSNSTVIGIVSANISGVYPTSNAAGTELGTSSRRWILNANTANFSGDVTITGNTTVNNATLNGTVQTISGNVTFDSGTLFVDSVNNRVGINNTSPTVAFFVDGAANVVTSVNSALLTVGTDFIANTTGVYHSGVVNADSHTVGSNFVANSSGLTSDGSANLTAATSTIRVGNSSVNSFVNSSTVSIGTGNFLVGVNVGSNVRLTNTSLLIGNSTANSTVTGLIVSVSNSTSTANVSPQGLIVSTTTVNSTGVYVGIGNFTTSANVGSNVNINTSAIFIGNTTVNSTVTSSLITISNATSTANLSPASLAIGSAVVNSTILTIGTGNFSTGANVGSNVNITTLGLQVGNSTVNTQVNSSVISTATGNFSSGANVGANVKLTTVLFSVGNSTVNSSVNSTGVFTTGVVNSSSLTVSTNFIANTTGVFHAGTINAASFTTTGLLANATVIVPTSNTILLGNSVGRFVISANTGDFTGTVTGTVANMSTSVNSALLTVGSSFIANTTGAYHTGTIEAAIFNSTSDINSKYDIKTIEDPISKVMGMRGVTFKWKHSDKDSMGLIAQEVERIIPDVVTTDINGKKSVSYDNIIGLLIEAIKIQQKQIDSLMINKVVRDGN